MYVNETSSHQRRDIWRIRLLRYVRSIARTTDNNIVFDVHENTLLFQSRLIILWRISLSLSFNLLLADHAEIFTLHPVYNTTRAREGR